MSYKQIYMGLNGVISNSHIILEIDSLMVVNTIHGLVQPPWTLKKTLTKLQQMIRDIDCETREEHMHVTIRGPLRIDKLNLASFRFKKEKHSGWHYECNV
ncbi:hypothetical protein H5410_036902 [Solanum commersonii]|uniref:Uncharacterized protein n=1 Tax=Solanum commersonii TaxID=4109 RepID=A0A9J5Y9K4_SOLCO|nr:hypothetical protein H5410_036902 [Solanum commersonii]